MKFTKSVQQNIVMAMEVDISGHTARFHPLYAVLRK